MEIKITGNSFATAVMDVNRFKNKLEDTWDLKEAVKRSVLVTENKEKVTEDKIIDMLIYLFDWAALMRNKYFREREKITFKFLPISYDGWVNYEPGEVSERGTRFKLNDKITEGKDVMVWNDFVPSSYFMIKCFVSATQFMYDEKEFNVLLTEKDL